MIATDEGALSCDMMETYHIMDWRALPARQAALFAYGLRDGSRIRQKLAGAATGLDTMLLAMIADGINLLLWINSKAGAEGRDRPASVLAMLRGGDGNKESVGFDTSEEFDAWRASMLGE